MNASSLCRQITPLSLMHASASGRIALQAVKKRKGERENSNERERERESKSKNREKRQESKSAGKTHTFY